MPSTHPGTNWSPARCHPWLAAMQVTSTLGGVARRDSNPQSHGPQPCPVYLFAARAQESHHPGADPGHPPYEGRAVAVRGGEATGAGLEPACPWVRAKAGCRQPTRYRYGDASRTRKPRGLSSRGLPDAVTSQLPRTLPEARTLFPGLRVRCITRHACSARSCSRQSVLPAEGPGCTAAVIVCADNFAFLDLRQDAPPRSAVADHSGDLELLVGQVVKVQDDNVRFSAVDARMLAKVCTYSFPGSRNSPLPRLAARTAEAIPGLQVVRGVVFLLAGLAPSVMAIPLSVVDWKAVKWLDLFALDQYGAVVPPEPTRGLAGFNRV
jgi:hypothetical protein